VPIEALEAPIKVPEVPIKVPKVLIEVPELKPQAASYSRRPTTCFFKVGLTGNELSKGFKTCAKGSFAENCGSMTSDSWV
jgi:hypothetical protein